MDHECSMPLAAQHGVGGGMCRCVHSRLVLMLPALPCSGALHDELRDLNLNLAFNFPDSGRTL